MNTSTSKVDKMPIGYRFQPTDEELINHYLKQKLLGNDSVMNIIAHVDLCKFPPWDLPALSKIKSDDSSEWFFFACLDLKFKSSTRCNRKTKDGFWKITGKDREIKTKGTNNVIGTKKILVFYKSCGSHHEKTNWVIHEYHATATSPDDKRNVVLCRLMEKAEKKAHSSSHIAAADFEKATEDLTPDVYASPEMNMEYFFPASPHEEEYSLPPPHEPVIEHTPSNTCFDNENSIEEFPFEISEQNNAYDSLFNSFLVDVDFSISEETSQNPYAFTNDSTPF